MEEVIRNQVLPCNKTHVKTRFLTVVVRSSAAHWYQGLTNRSIKSAGLSIKSAAFIPKFPFQNSFGQAVSGARVLNCKGHPHELHLSLSGSKLTLCILHLLLCSSSMSLFGYICFHLRKLVTPLAIDKLFKFVHRYWFMLVYALVRCKLLCGSRDSIPRHGEAEVIAAGL
jgi:hypothetical protein